MLSPALLRKHLFPWLEEISAITHDAGMPLIMHSDGRLTDILDDLVALGSLFVTAFVLYFFRDPERVTPDENDVLVAPADGKVILVEKVFDDKFVKEHVYKVSIFMNVFNVHVNRVPFSGTVSRVQYFPGQFPKAVERRHLGAVFIDRAEDALETPDAFANRRLLEDVQVVVNIKYRPFGPLQV